MIKNLFLVVFFIFTIYSTAHAQAPVVDDSENYAILEEGEAALQQPSSSSKESWDEETRLSKIMQTMVLVLKITLIKFRDYNKKFKKLRGQLEIQAHDLKIITTTAIGLL